MKYLVIGAGGTGGSIGAYMTEAGKDVTLIARGEHLKRMQEQGRQMEDTMKGNYNVDHVIEADLSLY
ncbi:MAG: NAD-binding protein, partial [Lachnospiraceae bacterium]|nr:NAD-binding protein [Lachnospiraceae bacterium]